MTTLAYYGLSFNPFDKQAVREKDRFLSADLKEMTSRLDYLKDSRGIGVFTASPGMGKSFALRCFAAGLNPGLYHMEYICLSTVSVMEFYRQFCSVLGLEDRGGKPGMFKAIQEQVYSLYKEKRKPLLLAVDEAQDLSTGTYFHVIAGPHKYGSFLCIPNHDIGCELADFSDIRWTVGRLCMHPIRKVDAVTVAAGISHLEKAAAVSG